MGFFFSWLLTRLCLFVLLFMAAKSMFLVEFPWSLLLLAPMLLEGGILFCYYSIRKWRTRMKVVLTTAPEAPREPEDEWKRAQACVVHEIKNCVSTLRGNTFLLRKQLTDDLDQETLRRLERAADKIVYLTQEVLAFPARGQSLDRKAISLDALVETCISDHFPDKKAHFEIHRYGSLPTISGEEEKLEQVFLNLFRNAFEAGARRINLYVWVDGKRLGVLIEDDGQGCTVADPESLFEPYTTTKSKSGGTGLGLYIVRAIVESHGGHIRLMPKDEAICEQSGMVFLLHFPIPEAAEMVELTAPPAGMLMAS